MKEEKLAKAQVRLEDLKALAGKMKKRESRKNLKEISAREEHETY